MTTVLCRNRYFVSGGDAYFLADSQLFRVHRYFFERESEICQQWFRSGGGSGSPSNGQTESTAIVLRVPAASFEKLLDVFYNKKYSVYNFSVDDWETIIQLAQEWKFPEVLELAIRELEKLDISLIQRIALYQKYHLEKKHLLPLYVTLCVRPQGLNRGESHTIGLDTVYLIYNIRERLRAQPSEDGVSPLPAGVDVDDAAAMVAGVLGIPIPSLLANV